MAEPVKIEQEAKHFLAEARHRDPFTDEFNKMPLKEQLAVTRAMVKAERNEEKEHPELPKVTIHTFESGHLKDVQVPRAWIDPRSGPKEVYHRDKDPQPHSDEAKNLGKKLLHGLGEVLRFKRQLGEKVERELLKQ